MALSPSPQPMSRTSPCTQPPSCHAMTFSLGALVSHGGVVTAGKPSAGLSPRYRASKSRIGKREEFEGDVEPVIFARVARNATLPGSRHPLTIRPERRRRRSGSRMGAAGDAATGRELMSAADVGRTISRIAHQIIEKTALDDAATRPYIVLLGIPTRGVTIAARLADKISDFSGVNVPHVALDITLYRDDLMMKPPRPLEDTSIPEGGLD